MGLTAPMIGKAGELRVRSELIINGFVPAVFDQDLGADIILDSGVKIQVKTSLKPSYTRTAYSWRYSFNIRQPQLRCTGNGVYARKFTKRDLSYVDFVVFYCVRDNLFYVVPSGEVGEKLSISLPTPEAERTYKKHTYKPSISKYEKYKNNWDLLRR